MSFLHPLFLLAVLAVAVPVLLHLARRRTRQEQPFSSLRFLEPSRPRLERRRRVEHWLLLLLRAAAIALLALTFARPFLSQPPAALARAGGKRLLVLVDTSASMRRQGAWSEALARARAAMAGAGAEDRLALLAFDDRVQTLVSFEAWAATPAAGRRSLVDSRLESLTPSFRGTDLGAALVAAGEAVLDDRTAAGQATMGEEATVVLVSDLQEGSRLSALGAADWPAGVRLRVERVSPEAGINLGLQALPPATAVGGGTPELGRVRVLASQGARDGEHHRVDGKVTATLSWKDGRGAAIPVELTLGPGGSGSLEVPVRPAALGTLVLTGDRTDFDNELHLAPPVASPARIVYVGEDAPAPGRDRAEGEATEEGARPTPLFFLRRAFPVTRSRAPKVLVFSPGDPALAAVLPEADLVVATAAPAAAAVPALRRYLEQGRLALLAPLGADSGEALVRSLVGPGIRLREAPSGREAVLTEVDLSHPILAPFADGRSSDFTKIRFWKRRLVAVDGAQLPAGRVLGRFDDGSPALLTAPVGRGQIFLLAASWDLADSQLALSSKLVPLLWTLLETSAGLASDRSQFLVGEPIPLPPARAGRRRLVHPDGKETALPAGASVFAGAERPGLYTLVTGADGRERRPFAVNLRPAESATAPLPLEHLERLGVRLHQEGSGAPGVTSAGAGAADLQRRREEAHARELEGRQRPWRFVLGAVFLALIGESWLAARRVASPAPVMAAGRSEA